MIVKVRKLSYKELEQSYKNALNTIERLNNKIKEQNLLLIEFQDMEQKVDIYKSRCEKAVEYIKKLSNKPNVFGHYGIDTQCKKWLLKILKGK